MINRGAVLLRYKQAGIEWLRSIKPEAALRYIDSSETQSERLLYLISDAACQTRADVEAWVKTHYHTLFKNELIGLFATPEHLPSELNYALFKEFFSVEFHSIVIDTSHEQIIAHDN